MDHVRTVVPNQYYSSPDFRNREAREWLLANSQATPAFKNRHQNYLVTFLRSDGTEEVVAAVFEAVALQTVAYARTILSALLMADAPAEEIRRITGVEEDTVLAFKDLFFDPAVFHNRLLKTAYIQRLPGVTEDEIFFRDMLRWALSLGYEYVEWRVTGKNENLPVVDILKGLLADSLWRSKEHILSRIGSDTSKEARAWLPHTIRLAETVSRLDSDRITSIEELRIQLTGLDITTNRNKLGSEVEILSVSTP
jgi:hypothetical protein